MQTWKGKGAVFIRWAGRTASGGGDRESCRQVESSREPGGARGLGGGRTQVWPGPWPAGGPLDVRPESWALERRPPASKEWPFLSNRHLQPSVRPEALNGLMEGVGSRPYPILQRDGPGQAQGLPGRPE